jgi:hypothetical protein
MRMERAKGIEPSYAAWEAAVLPLNYARILCSDRAWFYLVVVSHSGADGDFSHTGLRLAISTPNW